MHIAFAGPCRSHESEKKKKEKIVNSSPFRRLRKKKDAHNNKIISHKVSSIFYVFGIDCFHVGLIDM